MESAFGNTREEMKEAELGRGRSSTVIHLQKGFKQSQGGSGGRMALQVSPDLRQRSWVFFLSLSMGDWLWTALEEAHKFDEAAPFS